MDEPIVSVVVPVYCVSEKHEEYLTEALSSIAQQTFQDFEVIMVDDSSPRDIGPAIAAAGKLPRLKVIRNEKNLRHASSRNAGVKAAAGEFVAFLDHDDVWMPEKLERQLEEFRKYPEAGMVFCAVKAFGSHAGKLTIDQDKLPERPDFEWFMRRGNYTITASAVLVRRRMLEEIGFFDPRYTTSDDLDAWLKISRRAPILHMREQLVGYRLHSANTNYSVDRLNDTKLLFTQYFDFYLKCSPYRKFRLLILIFRKFIGRVYYRMFRFVR